MIAIESLVHSYSRENHLEFADWKINVGEQWLLLGDSGKGKTTLLHILTGLLKPSQGKVILNTTNLYDLSSKDLDRFRGRNIGMVFQKPHLIKSLTIAENLFIAQSFAKLPKDEKRIDDVLESLGIAGKKNNYPHQLSQGQLQRVSIGRAVINKPLIIFADEPTSSLDDKHAAYVLELLIHQTKINNTTLVVATHDKRVKDTISKNYLL